MGKEPKHSDETKLDLDCEYLDRAAESTRKALLDLFSAVAVQEGNYRLSNRLKSPARIRAKIQRKRNDARLLIAAEGDENPDLQKRLSYGPQHVTDAWGCRFVTLFQSEIPKTVKALLTALTDYNRKNYNEQITLREFVIYTNRPSGDPLSIANDTYEIVQDSSFAEQIKDLDTIIRPPENRKSAYSSVHFVFVKKFPGGTKEKWPELSFEVQVRDIFEEGWGEIQHKLLYSEKDIEASSRPEYAVSDSYWKPHLNALKIFVDGCSQHASLIKQNYDSLYKPPVVSADTLSATSRDKDRDAVMDVLNRVKAKPAALLAVDNAYRLLQEAGMGNE